MSLPQIIDPASPAGSDPVSQGDDQFRALKQLLVDVLGLPITPNQVTVAMFTVTANGVKGWEVLGSFVPGVGVSSFGAHLAPTINKAGSGTHALFSTLLLDALVIGAAAATVTEATTLYISGAPSGATNLYAFHVAAGNIRIDGIILINTAVTTSASPGDLVIPNNARLRAVNAAGTDTVPIIGLDVNNNVIINLGVLTLGLYNALVTLNGPPVR